MPWRVRVRPRATPPRFESSSEVPTQSATPRRIREAEEHLRVADSAFAMIIDASGPCRIGERSADDATPYAALVTSVVSQQLSTPIARTLNQRLLDLVGGDLSPLALGQMSVEELREIGLSRAKARTILGLTEAVTGGQLDLDELAAHGEDTTVIEQLTTLWGIGPWTAHMFLIFHLGRLDVWPTGDLGVRKGWQVIHGGDGDPGADALVDAADHLQPYRSVAAWYCWRAWEAAT